jgi:rod shape determining protein RodA
MLEKIKRIDWSVVIIMLMFMGISTALVHSSIQADPGKFGGYDRKNLIFYGLGFVAMFTAAFFNYRWLIKGAVYLYLAGVALLALVLEFGATYNGASGWFKLPIPGFDLNFQPAELMKLLLILMIAYFLSRRRGEPLRIVRDLFPLGLLVLVPFGLVMIQPDLGNAIIYLAIFFGMMWIGNLKYVHALLGLMLMAGVLFGFYYVWQTYHDEIVDYLKKQDNEHWAERIDTFLNPDQVDPDAIYQVRNSRIAIGSGGLTGEGFKQGEYVKNGFVPLTYSDSIFIVVGEEFGFIGASVLLLLYFLLIYRLIWLSIQCDDLSGSFFIVGIVSMYVFQIFENIGMSIGIMPLTGITLPFVSYGGTSLLINMTCLGIVLSTRLYQTKPSAI